MSKILELNSQSHWSNSEKTAFKFFGIYFFLHVLPIDLRFFKHLFSTNWLHVQYRDIFYLSRYSPTFTGYDSFINWLIIIIIAAIGTFLWDKIYTKEINYDKLYYWLRVLVRYRLAIGIIAYGFLKFFPIQAPFPSISNLNTNYGDFNAWKLFSLGLGVVPNYQSFLGLVEIISGLLLLNRKTTTIATLIILPFAGNVAISNIAYEGGEYVYAFYLVSLALYLFAFDAIRLFNLLSLDKPTAPNRFQPVFSGNWKRYRIGLKTIFILFFVVFYGLRTYAGYKNKGYHFPKTKGIENISGLYNVSEFRWNNQVIPYSKTDSTRWQNIVFEKWNTISIKSNKHVIIENLPTEELYNDDASRIYELAGTQGRHYYSYDFDSTRSTLSLQNRNKNHPFDKFSLSFKKLNDSTIVLSGISTGKDSVYAVLNKINKKYLTIEAKKAGRRNALKL
ncbi:DoxX family protein [Emticicia sp. C21]|uniref:DoxX family protein n=1 Tax=Emticicia sp. C21 TaxID=2302915 RepID=UPI000E351A2F|nr:DoxX family protein [Emticicia sp. C21]RFS14544.1 DoxX family protein [Emticicia sp. C21]